MKREAQASLFCQNMRGCEGKPANNGAIAKRLCPGLQIRSARFDSGSRLQQIKALPQCKAFFFGDLLIAPRAVVCLLCSIIHPLARVVKLVDTADLKSAASRKRAYGFDPRPGHHRAAHAQRHRSAIVNTEYLLH